MAVIIGEAIVDVRPDINLENYDFENIKIDKKFGNRIVVRFNRHIKIDSMVKVYDVIKDLYSIKGDPVYFRDRIIVHNLGIKWWLKNKTKIRMIRVSVYLATYFAFVLIMIFSTTYIVFYFLISVIGAVLLALATVKITHDDDNCDFLMEWHQ